MLAHWNGNAAKSAWVAALLAASVLLFIAVSKLLHASEQRARTVRTSSEDLRLAQGLRFDAERIASVGERFPTEAARASFHRTLETLVHRADTVEGRVLLAGVAQDARAYEAALALAPYRDEPVMDEAHRRRAHRTLDDSIAWYVVYEEALVERAYRDAERAFRAAVLVAIISLVGLVASAGLLWRFNRKVATAHRREQTALRRESDATAARDEVLRIVAHDLRSPLLAILFKATMIRSSDAPGAAKQAESIERIVMRMDRLIKELLDLTNIEAGRFVLHSEPCEASQLLSKVVDTFGPLAAARSIDLDVTVPPHEVVIADRERVLQVLSSLVDNAIKFSSEHGTIAISASPVGADMRFVVRDTGRGIAPEHLPHVFERSWKAEIGGKRSAGLGLYIARHIIEAHGGAMSVESTPGVGSSFSFTLPRPADRPKPAAGAALHPVA